ncbi:hypothetical protein SRHO_G00288510 [Serrasalmus rhombeus]
MPELDVYYAYSLASVIFFPRKTKRIRLAKHSERAANGVAKLTVALCCLRFPRHFQFYKVSLKCMFDVQRNLNLFVPLIVTQSNSPSVSAVIVVEKS